MALISHDSKAVLKILHGSLQQYVNWELQMLMYKLDLEKAEELEIRLSIFVES